MRNGWLEKSNARCGGGKEVMIGTLGMILLG